MNFLEAIATIPMRRLVVTTLLTVFVFIVAEQLPWAQSFFEHLLNMEALK